jgi:hypothetical protein
MSASIQDPAHALRFLLAGNAHATFVSSKTAVRFTYRVTKNESPATVTAPSHFVSVLTGPDHYEYLGFIYEGSKVYVHGQRSRVNESTPSARAFPWVWGRLVQGRVPKTVEVYHEGRCGRCGRRLTTPESVTQGLGPECAKRAS